MSDFSWTPSQRRAIETTGQSMLVSAAAGSGKTAVLAERCARIVADSRPPCPIDRLLVVTFTEAAALQMRGRIAEALRKRIEERPDDTGLHRQLDLLESASISTLHAFCRRLLNRHFAQAELDPQAPILDEADAKLMRQEAAEQLFDRFAQREDAEGQSFRDFMDCYAPSDHQRLVKLVQSLHGFLSSLPDPDRWVREALARFDGASPESLSRYWLEMLVSSLRDELTQQRAAVLQGIDQLTRLGPAAAYSLGALQAYLESLGTWDEKARHVRTPVDLDALCVDQIVNWNFPDIPRKSKKSCPEGMEAGFDFAKDIAKHTRDNLFKKNLATAFGGFKANEWAAGIARTAPHVRMFLRLTEALRRDYQIAKAELGVIDFNDLERKALDLLRDETNGVAARLRDQYEHVLVDEFQDINPVQAEILLLVSRENQPGRAANLFSVGDVKQSIYRFRLAEPQLFLKRRDRFTGREANTNGIVVPLSENFRSRPRLLDALNLIFDRLIAGDLGGIDYDEDARLRPAPGATDRADGPVVELHVLDDVTRGSGNGDGSEDESEAGEGEEWQRIEREAYVVAQSIHQSVAEGRDYKDIVVLLRSMQARAGLFVRTLSRLGIPVQTEGSGGFFETLEVQDVLALLAVLDNQQQDIPLATVLRSNILGTALCDSQLVEIRTVDRAVSEMPFHAAVRQYAEVGKNEPLRLHLKAILNRISHWRQRARRRVLADVLWEIYEDSGCLAFVGGLRDGLQRRANLLRLHEHARRFGTFQRQGLYRFLRFIDALRDSDADLEPGSVAAQGGSAVRVMTIHKSKGLEFPVVILAELGKRFNLGDASGSIVFDRRLGLGLEAVDTERRIIYPTLPHRLVCRALAMESIAEELRVLYVAMTRAKERLILVGTKLLANLPNATEKRLERSGPLPVIERRAARTMMDWVVQAVFSLDGAVVSQGEVKGESGDALIGLRSYPMSEMAGWRFELPPKTEAVRRLQTCAELQPLDPGEPSAKESSIIRMVEHRLGSPYARAELAKVPAVAAASTLKQRWNATADAEDPPATWPAQEESSRVLIAPKFEASAFMGMPPPADAADQGTWMHLFFEHLDMTRPGRVDDLRDELNGLVHAGRFTKQEADSIDLENVAWFLSTPLGTRMRQHAAQLHREWPFVIGVDPARYERTAIAQDDQDLLLVRGVIDCLFDAGGGWEIVDYKTDRVVGGALAERAGLYRGQLNLYAQAVKATWGRNPAARHLVFLHAREIVSFD